MTEVVIIGAGRGGRALLGMFADDPTVTISYCGSCAESLLEPPWAAAPVAQP